MVTGGILPGSRFSGSWSDDVDISNELGISEDHFSQPDVSVKPDKLSIKMNNFSTCTFNHV